MALYVYIDELGSNASPVRYVDWVNMHASPRRPFPSAVQPADRAPKPRWPAQR